MVTTEKLKDMARAQTRSMLTMAPSFHAMDTQEQMELYRDLVNARYNELAQQSGLSVQAATGASSLIDDKRHLNQRMDQLGDIAEDFVDSVDFPQFVEDLLKAVFDANLKVTIEQMRAYTELMKAATASIAKFVNQIDDTMAFGYLAENNSDEFSIDFPPEGEKEADGSPKAVLVDKEGNRLDIGDNELKARIMDAKIAMAREQRAILRETILMGVTRLVVTNGKVKASVVFDFKAKEKIEKGDRAAKKHERVSAKTHTTSGGFLGSILGGSSGGGSTTTKTAQISVSSAKSIAETDLAAKLTGDVEITFKTDYFKLDNFAQMYGPIQQQAPSGVGAAPGSGPALPAATPPPTTPRT